MLYDATVRNANIDLRNDGHCILCDILCCGECFGV